MPVLRLRGLPLIWASPLRAALIFAMVSGDPGFPFFILALSFDRNSAECFSSPSVSEVRWGSS